MNHEKTFFSTEIFSGAIISVVQYLAPGRYGTASLFCSVRVCVASFTLSCFDQCNQSKGRALGAHCVGDGFTGDGTAANISHTLKHP
jgi:hypothetical protein